MMEKHGEIRKGLTPPETPEEQELSLPEAAEELLKEAEDRFKQLEAHMFLPEDQRAEWQAGNYGDFPEAGTDEFCDLFKLHYVFAFIWSIGGNIDEFKKTRYDFNNWFLQCKNYALALNIEKRGLFDQRCFIQFKNQQERFRLCE